MAIRRIPISEMPQPFQSKVQEAQGLGLDTHFLEVVINAPHMVDFYWGQFYEGVFFQLQS